MASKENQAELVRNQLAEAIQNYCGTVFDDNDTFYNERLVAGVQAFLQVNYYKEMYLPLIGIETVENKKWWQFWKKV